MSNNSIYDKISEKASLEANQIIEDAKKLAKEEKDKIIANQTSKSNDQINSVKEKISSQTQTVLSSIKQNDKQTTLIYKKKLIHNAYLSALDDLCNCSEKDLFKYVIDSLKNIKFSKDVEIKVSEKDYDVFNKLFSSKKDNNLDILSKELKTNIKFNLIKNFANIKGGFIVLADAFDIDLSFEEALRLSEEKMEKTLADLMFKVQDAK